MPYDCIPVRSVLEHLLRITQEKGPEILWLWNNGRNSYETCIGSTASRISSQWLVEISYKETPGKIYPTEYGGDVATNTTFYDGYLHILVASPRITQQLFFKNIVLFTDQERELFLKLYRLIEEQTTLEKFGMNFLTALESMDE